MCFNAFQILLFISLSTLLIGVSSKIISKREIGGQLDNQMGYLPTAEKRPFCNAFTGCGKKRSNFGTLDNREIDPLMQLSRRILKEAKQWEILQNKLNNELSQSETPLLNYLSVRKRRSVDDTQHNLRK